MANLTNMSLEAFKSKVGETAFDVVKSPKTGKLFLAGKTTGVKYKVEQAIDATKPVEMLVDADDISLSSMINVRDLSANVVATF